MVDCHRHLGGSIGVDCVWEIIKKSGLTYMASCSNDVHRAMTFHPSEPTGFHRFLGKFSILDELKWDENTIELTVKSVCEQLNDEGLEYCWLDFSINKYMHLGWHKKEAITYIYKMFDRYRPGKVGLILSLKYESLRETQRQYAKLIEDPDIHEMLIGIDLVGDEAYFDAGFYASLLKPWKLSGKMVRAHVGESQSEVNVEHSIRRIGVTNIAHGLKCYQSPDIIQLAIDNDIAFDMTITSNYLTGVWVDREHHPIIDLIQAGCNVTLGSDDPTQCNTTLALEYERLTSLSGQGLYNDLLKAQAIKNTNKYVPTLELL